MGITEIGVGMIGAGSMARRHLDAWRQVEEARVVAIYNRTRTKAEALAQEYGIPNVCADVENLICREDVDAVSISMPHNLHHPLALSAVQAGRHVFCEKPLATTLRDAGEMWERAQQAGVRTGIQFMHRFSPILARLHALLRDGYVGQVQRLECSWCLDWARDPSFPLVWRFKREVAGAGALADLGVYMIDAARWLIGEFRSVSGSLRTYVVERPILSGHHNFDEVVRMTSESRLPTMERKGQVENEDDCVFVASFENGAYGVFWVSRVQREQRLVVYGSEGTLSWRLKGDELLGKRGDAARPEEISVPAGAGVPSFVSQFAAGIRAGVERSPSFYDGLKAQEVIEAVLQSAREQRWVSISELAGGA